MRALHSIENIASEPLESLKLLVSENSALRENKEFVSQVNELLKKNEVGELVLGSPSGGVEWDGDILF